MQLRIMTTLAATMMILIGAAATTVNAQDPTYTFEVEGNEISFQVGTTATNEVIITYSEGKPRLWSGGGDNFEFVQIGDQLFMVIGTAFASTIYEYSQDDGSFVKVAGCDMCRLVVSTKLENDERGFTAYAVNTFRRDQFWGIAIWQRHSGVWTFQPYDGPPQTDAQSLQLGDSVITVVHRPETSVFRDGLTATSAGLWEDWPR